jgi:Domain of unknown function (DUF4351)
LLVKVYLQQGQEVWLCIHLEVQATPEKVFAKRMFVYNARIFQLYDHPVISLAILSDNNRRWRPQAFAFEFPGTSLHFQFGTAKLLDFQAQMDTLVTNNNPFALVVLAHLQAKATRKDNQRRQQVKFTLVRLLYERGYNKQQVLDLFRFIDWVITLPAALKQEFWQQLRSFEEERRMPYITSVEEIGFERGIQAGVLQGERLVTLRQLNHQLGKLPAALTAQVEALTLPQLEALSEALLDFKVLADLQTWLSQHAGA